MQHKTIITENYIILTSDEEIKEGEWCYIPFENSIKRFGKYFADDWKKIIGHLPITDSADLRGVPLLPSLPDDVDTLASEWIDENGHKWSNNTNEVGDNYGSFRAGYEKHAEKYKFTEEDLRKAYDYGSNASLGVSKDNLIQSLSQPKYPTGFKCEMESISKIDGYLIDDYVWVTKSVPNIINGILQGEWIY